MQRLTPAFLAPLLLASAASLSLAQSEPLPGLISAAEHQAAHEEAQKQAEDARAAVTGKARELGATDAEIARVLQPTMIRSGHFVVTLEDGTRIRFPWYRIGFAENGNANTEREVDATRGETNKGGVRLHKGVFAEEVYALALKMDAKLAIAGDAAEGRAFRGAKGGIGAGEVIEVGSHYAAQVGDIVDPAAGILDRAELMRGFGEGYLDSGAKVGLNFDIQAGDVNTKAPQMRVLSDTYDPSAPSEGVSGKEVLRLPDGSIDPRGGIEYRAISTGEGVWMSARRGLEGEGVAVEKATVVSQGWGEVGRAFGLAAVREGARLIGIQELWNVGGEKVAGLLSHPQGDQATPEEVRSWVEAVEELRSSGADLKTFRGGELYRAFQAGGDVSTVKVDVVGYNALGDVLTEKTVPALAESGTTNGKRKVIAEGANLAETFEGAAALDALQAKLLAIPGDLANLGGVHVSDLEAIQNRFLEVVTNEQARRSLEETIRQGWERAEALARERGISMRKAIELLSTAELMKRSLQREDATRNSLERGVISPEAIARRQALLKGESPEQLARTLERLARYRRADGTLRWRELIKDKALSEGIGVAHFALALFLKEVAVVASTGDRARIEEFFDGLLSTDFYKQYGLFALGARAGEVAYTRYLQRYIKPRFVDGLLKTNLVLAAGLALPMIVEGRFSGKTLAISLGSLGLSSAAVRTGVEGIKWVLDLKKAQRTGLLARVGAGAGRLARLGGWFYSAAELGVVLYLSETIEARVNEALDRAAAHRRLAAAGQTLVDALAGADPTQAAAAVRAYGDAWIAYREFLYRSLDADQARFDERLAKLARRAKLAADQRAATLANLEQHPALKANVLRRHHGSLDEYAAALAKQDEAELQQDLAQAFHSYETSRAAHLDEVYTQGRRDGALLEGVEDLDWLLGGARAGAAGDPWGGRSGAFARWGRGRSRAGLTRALKRASSNRLQSYDDEDEVLAALAKTVRQDHPAVAEVLEQRRRVVRALQAADAHLVQGGGLVAPTPGSGMEDTLRQGAPQQAQEPAASH